VGPGLIGGSIALRARTLGATILGWDADEAALAGALRAGILDEALPTFEALAQAGDVLVLCAPVDATERHVRALEASPAAASLVLDVASVKGPIARAGADVPHFVATHPMAGSERSGYGAARADLFVEKIWAYDAAAAGADRTEAVAFIREMGAHPLPIDVDEHDRIVALTSHLPQVLSVLLGAKLAGNLERAEVSALCGTGIASMLRLGRSAWSVWRPVLEANAAPLAQEVRELAAILNDAATALENGRADELERAFRAAFEAGRRLDANGLPATRVVKTNDTHESEV